MNNSIRRKRLEMGYTQSELALKIGSVQQRIYEWETGKFTPSIHTLIKLAIALDTTIDELVGKEE